MTDITITENTSADQTTTESSVTVRGLSKAYAGTRSSKAAPAVDDISFDVPRGQFLTLLGPSGCGKTTTLRCIAGLEQPTGGRISMAGLVVYDEAQRKTVRPEDRPIAMVPQSYGIWPHMTVLENAAFSLRHGRNRRGQKNIKQRTIAMLEQVGLEPYADRWATQLSGGQQQRLALARALLSEPEVLLLDEPLSNLDAKLRSRLRLELREFQEKFGVTTVYVTHDQSEALALSDTIVLMNGGRIEQIDAPENIYERPDTVFAADFIGSANLIPVTAATGTASEVKAETALGEFLCSSSGQAQPEGQGDGFVCVRPENVEVLADSAQATPTLNEAAGTVTGAEYLGDKLELIVDLGSHRIRASTRADLEARPGDHVVVRLAPRHLRYLAH